jgi:hypothetical protein
MVSVIAFLIAQYQKCAAHRSAARVRRILGEWQPRGSRLRTAAVEQYLVAEPRRAKMAARANIFRFQRSASGRHTLRS